VERTLHGAPDVGLHEHALKPLAISKSMAWKLVAYGQLRSVRIGRTVRVRPSDVEEYLARSTRDA
jgi:excisionase family DNA binding protein